MGTLLDDAQSQLHFAIRNLTFVYILFKNTAQDTSLEFLLDPTSHLIGWIRFTCNYDQALLQNCIFYSVQNIKSCSIKKWLENRNSYMGSYVISPQVILSQSMEFR